MVLVHILKGNLPKFLLSLSQIKKVKVALMVGPTLSWYYHRRTTRVGSFRVIRDGLRHPQSRNMQPYETHVNIMKCISKHDSVCMYCPQLLEYTLSASS